MAVKHSNVQAKRGRDFASNRLLKNRFGMPSATARVCRIGVGDGPMGPETTVAAPTRRLGGPGRPPETPGGRVEPSTGHPGGTGVVSGAARCLIMHTWSSKGPSRQSGLPSQIPGAETGPLPRPACMKMKLVINCGSGSTKFIVGWLCWKC